MKLKHLDNPRKVVFFKKICTLVAHNLSNITFAV